MIDIDTLRDPDRTLLGARAAGYPDTDETFTAQHEAHAERIHRTPDLVKTFASVGQIPFSDRHVRAWARDKHRPTLVHNWKPARHWNQINHSHVATAAAAVSSLAPRPVVLIVHHEPENDVGSFGTAQDYRRMWARVRNQFDDAGVDNVVWAMAYMNYHKWDHLVTDVYPGDDLVDWLMFNAYGSQARPDFASNVSRFIDLVDAEGIGAGKPLGIAEWGINADADGASYYEQAAAWLDTAESDRITSMSVFDSPGSENASGLRLGYDTSGRAIDEKTEAYRHLARHHAFAPSPAGDSHD